MPYALNQKVNILLAQNVKNVPWSLVWMLGSVQRQNIASSIRLMVIFFELINNKRKNRTNDFRMQSRWLFFFFFVIMNNITLAWIRWDWTWFSLVIFVWVLWLSYRLLFLQFSYKKVQFKKTYTLCGRILWPKLP